MDSALLETQVKDMYRDVARKPDGDFHFEMGAPLAARLGYPPELLAQVPPEALASFAGVGWALDLAALQPGERVVDLGSGSGTDVFAAAALVGRSGSVIGVEMTDAQLEKAEDLRRREALGQVSFVEARIEDIPLRDATADAVISNGVINLCPDKPRVFAEAARLLRPGGRLALADIVSGKPLAERTRARTDLWAACIAGAIPEHEYVATIEAAGLRVLETRENEGYRFISERAIEACTKYEVKSISLLAVKG